MENNSVVMWTKPERTDKKRSSSIQKCYYAALGAMIVSLICQLIGYLAPGWLRYFHSSSVNGTLVQHYELDLGIWILRLCTHTAAATVLCDTDATSDYTDGIINEKMEQYQVMTTIGLSACIIAVAFLLIKARKAHSRGALVILVCIIAIMFCLVSGVPCLVAVGKFARYQQTHFVFTYDVSPLRAPYALILTGIGGVIACVVFILLIIFEWCRYQFYDDHDVPVIAKDKYVMAYDQPVVAVPVQQPYEMRPYWQPVSSRPLYPYMPQQQLQQPSRLVHLPMYEDAQPVVVKSMQRPVVVTADYHEQHNLQPTRLVAKSASQDQISSRSVDNFKLTNVYDVSN